MYIQFPASFLWGASLSSYQCEGENFNSDWYLWEKENSLTLCGSATRHYYLYKTDFTLAKEIGLKAIRTSLEWSRINPEENKIEEEALLYYKDVINTLYRNNLLPVLTLNHFTLPIWFYKKGGWQKSSNIDYFLSYVRDTVSFFRDDIKYWLVINEPIIYIFQSYIRGSWPPGKRSVIIARKVFNNLKTAYIEAYKIIKDIYAEKDVYVSFAKNFRYFMSCHHYNLGQNTIIKKIRDNLFNWKFLDEVRVFIDFIGVNYYSAEYSKFKFPLGDECFQTHRYNYRNGLNWLVCPYGLYKILLELKKRYHPLPVIITENGTVDTEDGKYALYLKSHIQQIGRAIKDGVDIRGYFWWSLLDNFEWDKGFGPRFGLFFVDYRDFSRKKKQFVEVYSQICVHNRIEI